MAARTVRYRIFPRSPEAHLFEVSVTVDAPDPAGQRFVLPAWIPGSYMVREFARHVVTIRARHGRRPVRLRKLDKHTWRADPCDGPLTVTAEVYAWDASVRGAHLDTTHGFFNGACVFLRVVGHDAAPCEVEIVPPRGARYRGWRVATAMRRKRAPRYGFGTYAAAGYEELIDHPVEMGTFALGRFTACGVPHEIALTGRQDADLPRLERDLRRLCETHIRFWGEPAPMDRYVFLVTALGEGYGGLEHRASTALLCSRDDLPRRGVRDAGEAYRTFLGLASHEYFHAWNVKRIRPAAFAPSDLSAENYTELLWAFEGVTSYYDDLALRRAGLITEADYLVILGRSATALARTPGRLRQTVAESSWDAWIKYYRLDENSPNAIVSYYNKGSLIALCLDLAIRRRTRGRKSLDDVMRALWERHGRTDRGVPEDGFERLADAVTGLRLAAFFERALRTTAELPLAAALRSVGLRIVKRPAESPADRGGRAAAKGARELAGQASFGARTETEGSELKLTHVLDGGAAQRAGLAAGDVVAAIDGLRTTPKTFPQLIARRRPGDRVRVHAFRRDELREFDVVLDAAPADTCVVEVAPRDGGAPRRRRRAWQQG
ncbi:MAG: M61 family metallopeptidase [Burkholderiales bacterium]|nr:M61 family metallopeptidase [Burkholderiales bacterium]